LFSTAVCIALIIDISLRNHKKFVEIVTDDPQCTELVSNKISLFFYAKIKSVHL